MAAIVALIASIFFFLIKRPVLGAIAGAGFIFCVIMFICEIVRQNSIKKNDDAHSQAFKELKHISESGYERTFRGFYPGLLDGLYEWERDEIEDYIWNSFNYHGYGDMAPLLPELRKYDGISGLRNKLSSVEKDSPEYKTIEHVLSGATGEKK